MKSLDPPVRLGTPAGIIRRKMPMMMNGLASLSVCSTRWWIVRGLLSPPGFGRSAFPGGKPRSVVGVGSGDTEPTAPLPSRNGGVDTAVVTVAAEVMLSLMLKADCGFRSESVSSAGSRWQSTSSKGKAP